MRRSALALLTLLACSKPTPAPAPDAGRESRDAGAAAPSPLPMEPVQVTHCPDGQHSFLEIQVLRRPDMMRHDHDIGSDRLVLRDATRAEVLRVDSHDAHFRCLGVIGRDRHLVGSMFERGAWFVLGAISYAGVHDGSSAEGQLVPSAFTRDDYLALASTVSPGGRYVAFVGGHGTVEGLFVLDTETDTVRKLGRAPMPPPEPFGLCSDRFAWGSCGADGYVELEPEVMQFLDEHTLLVRYGADTRKKRAAKRTTQRFTL